MSEEKHEEKTVSHTETHEHKSDEHKPGEHGKGGEKPPGPKVASISKAPAKRKSMPKGVRYAMRAAIVMVALFCVGAIIAALVRGHGGSNVAVNKANSNAASGSASTSPQCPGGRAKVRELGPEWVDVRPGKPYAVDETPCDFVYGILEGTIELDNGYTPKAGDTGRTSSAPTKVHATSGRAKISYLLCEPGLGSTDGTPRCK